MNFACNKRKGGVNVPQRRRRPKAPGEAAGRFCSVCGDKAENYNFGQISCESCKAFFRRNAHKTFHIHCVFGGSDCLITVNSRKRCPACRLRKCFDVGMQPDLIQITDGSIVGSSVEEKLVTSPDGCVTPAVTVMCNGTKQDDGNAAFTSSFMEKRSSSSGSSVDMSSNLSPLSPSSYVRSKAPLLLPDLEIKSFPPSTCQLLLHQPPLDILPDKKTCQIKLQLLDDILQKSIICTYKMPYSLSNLHRSLKERQEDWTNVMNQLEIFIRQTIYFARLIPEIQSLSLESRIQLLKLRLPTFLLIVFVPLWRPTHWKFLFNIEGCEYEAEPTETVANILEEDNPIHKMGEYCTALQELSSSDWHICAVYAILKCFDISEYKEGLHLEKDTLLCNKIFFSYLALLRVAFEQKFVPTLAAERFHCILRLFQWSRVFDKAIKDMLENMPLNAAQFSPILQELCQPYDS